MNLMLFHSSEKNQPLARDDWRVRHLREVLRLAEGDVFAAGEINGELGRGVIEEWNEEQLCWRFEVHAGLNLSLPSLTLAVGMSRPQTMRKILQEGTALGCSRLVVYPAERSDPSYAKSSLWTTEEWKTRLMAGVEQAFTTKVPELVRCGSLKEALTYFREEEAKRCVSVVLDNYEASASLPEWLTCQSIKADEKGFTLWIGPERGWGKRDRKQFRDGGCPFVHLGPRVLRVETALLVAQGQLLAKLGAWQEGTPSVTAPSGKQEG